MQTTVLGRTGIAVSRLCLGTMTFGEQNSEADAHAQLDYAVAHGINFIDAAEMYPVPPRQHTQGLTEAYIGSWLKARGGRDRVVIATKVAGRSTELAYARPFPIHPDRRNIEAAIDASLRRLKTDYIDLYQVHRPDENTPEEETLRALDDLVSSGKVRYIGNSNYSGWQIANSHWIAETKGYAPYISAQNEYSLLDRRIEAEVVPAAEKFGLSILPFFPLASGLLTGKYQRNADAPEGTRLASGPMADRLLTDRNFDKVEALEEFAKQRGHTLLELAFSWLATQKFVGSVIAGATRPEQVKANAAAAAWRLTAEEMADVDKITKR